MVESIKKGTYVYRGTTILGHKDEISISDIGNKLRSLGEDIDSNGLIDAGETRKNTITYGILANHNKSGNMDHLKIKFDAMASHDITYVGIIQTAKASGLKEFPIPYVLTNCHNSLCAVGGTINEDDHSFGLSAAKKYGGIYVPAHLAVIHQYMREMASNCGSMILGSDSHTRYGALGTMGIGEGGPELVKQLLNKTYDISCPEVIAIYLEGKPQRGVGPQDVALSIIGAVFNSGFAKNKVLEFIGPGISGLSVDYRNGIDTMTTETSCLSSIWCTDEKVEDYYRSHHRPEGYAKLEPGVIAYYDGIIKVDLCKVEPMIALPFHPSNVYKISELNDHASDILRKVEEDCRKQIDNPSVKFSLTDKITDKGIKVDQGIIAGCAGGTYENIEKAAAMLAKKSAGNDYFNMNVYPASQPVYLELLRSGAITKLMQAGAIVKTAFCGPCFGAGDVPAANSLSIRHTTRNFPYREGSKPGMGQIASVALMDSLSIAATAINGGILTPATEMDIPDVDVKYGFDSEVYNNRVYFGYKKALENENLRYGPNISDWPEMSSLADNLLLKIVSVINDPVTTTDELIPSGETSSYRSNPMRLAEYTLSRRDPQYVQHAKKVKDIETARQTFHGDFNGIEEVREALFSILGEHEYDSALSDIIKNTQFGSVIFAVKPGDGSAREQAASCQKVLGGMANIAVEYATKRYRSNLINWGMIPFTIDPSEIKGFEVGDYLFIRGIKDAILNGKEDIKALVVSSKGKYEIPLHFSNLTQDEREIILAGCLINYYAKENSVNLRHCK